VIQRLGVARSPALAVSLPTSLEQGACYRYCEALVRARHHNYPVASMFARSQLRKHIFALFAFARVADDFADEAAYEGRRARELDRWEEQLHTAYRGHAEHPVFVALADTVDKFALPITEFTELMSGFRTDLERRRYATFDELRSYTRQAAEPIGRLLLYIAGYRAPELPARRPLRGPRHLPTVTPVATTGSPAGRPEAQWCVRCGETGIVLLASCPSCGVLPLCADCIVAHIAEICAQEGRTLGP